MNGMMDEIAIFNSELTQAEIQAYMTNPPNGSEEDLAAYWKFNSGEGDILYDHSGNANHGTLNGLTGSPFTMDQNGMFLR